MECIGLMPGRGGVPLAGNWESAFDCLDRLSSSDTDTASQFVPSPLLEWPTSQALPPPLEFDVSNEEPSGSMSRCVPAARVREFVVSLTPEERQLMEQEGARIPAPDEPVTKAAERDLKKLRRKIKNKLSAKDSRRRRKEYMDNLETDKTELADRLQAMTRENHILNTQLQTLHEFLRPKTPLGARSTMMMMFFLMVSGSSSPVAAPAESSELAASASLRVPGFTTLALEQAQQFRSLLEQTGLMPGDMPAVDSETTVQMAMQRVPIPAGPRVADAPLPVPGMHVHEGPLAPIMASDVPCPP